MELESLVVISLLVLVCMVLVFMVAIMWLIARSTNNSDQGRFNVDFKPNIACTNNPTPRGCTSCENLYSSFEGREKTLENLRQRFPSRSPQTGNVSSENAMALMPVRGNSDHMVTGNGVFDLLSPSSSHHPPPGSLTEAQMASAGMHDRKTESVIIDLKKRVDDLAAICMTLARRMPPLVQARMDWEPEKFETTSSSPYIWTAKKEGCELKTPDCRVNIPADSVSENITTTVRSDYISPNERAMCNGRVYISPDIVFGRSVCLSLEATVGIRVNYIASDVEAPILVKVEAFLDGVWRDICDFLHRRDDWICFGVTELSRFAVYVRKDQFERMSRKLFVIISQKKSPTGRPGEDPIRWNIFDGNHIAWAQIRASLERDGFETIMDPEPIFVRHGADTLLQMISSSTDEFRILNTASRWGSPVNEAFDFFISCSPEAITCRIITAPGDDVIFRRDFQPKIRNDIPDHSFSKVSRSTGRRRSLRSELLTPQASVFNISSSSTANSSDSDASRRQFGRVSPVSEFSTTSSRSDHSDISSTNSSARPSHNFDFSRQSFGPPPRGPLLRPEGGETHDPLPARSRISPNSTTNARQGIPHGPNLPYGCNAHGHENGEVSSSEDDDAPTKKEEKQVNLGSLSENADPEQDGRGMADGAIAQSQRERQDTNHTRLANQRQKKNKIAFKDGRELADVIDLLYRPENKPRSVQAFDHEVSSDGEKILAGNAGALEQNEAPTGHSRNPSISSMSSLGFVHEPARGVHEPATEVPCLGVEDVEESEEEDEVIPL